MKAIKRGLKTIKSASETLSPIGKILLFPLAIIAMVGYILIGIFFKD